MWSFGPYFVEPIVAGLDPKTGETFISVCDLIGQACVVEDFAVIGTSNEQLYGMCEVLWQPNLVINYLIYYLDSKKIIPILLNKEPDDLFECISQSLMNAFDRDAYSGWGAVVYVMWV